LYSQQINDDDDDDDGGGDDDSKCRTNALRQAAKMLKITNE